MLAFFEQTWFLWWVAALVVILRWFHVASADGAWEVPASDHVETPDPMPDQLHLFLR